MAIVDAAPPPGTTPTPQQMRDLLGKVAGIYEGIRIGSAAVRGLSMDLPEGPFSLAAARLTNLENGKIAELALEGLEGEGAAGTREGRTLCVEGLDIANLMRSSAQFAASRRDPSPEQLLALLLLLEGAEMSRTWSRPTRTRVSRS